MLTVPKPIRAFRVNSGLFRPALFERILSLWFETQPESSSAPTPRSFQRWFKTGASEDAGNFDVTCREACLPALESIGPSKLSLPELRTHADEVTAAGDFTKPFRRYITPTSDAPEEVTRASEHALALVLLLDQMPRNIFREDQAVIYSHYDLLSRAISRAALAATPRSDHGPTIRYNLARRMWFYLPYMHSEHLEDHSEFDLQVLHEREDMRDQEDLETAFNRQDQFEASHLAVIRRFGRYPYRNEVLGRQTTDEEKEWLKNGETFSA